VWQYVQGSPRLSVMVVQDLDQPPGRSCAWGDVATGIFLRLGSVGAVTNGGVRDIREVEQLGFHLFAPAPVVGHSYIRFIEINTPVKVGLLVVRPGARPGCRGEGWRGLQLRAAAGKHRRGLPRHALPGPR
jgi:regulator of RNase E activity RraA